MLTNGEIGARRRISPWRIFGWGCAIGLILLPLVAMQFTTEVKWTAPDFVAAALMIGLTGGALEVAVRMSANAWGRAGAAVMILASFLLVWMNLAAGLLGGEDNPANILFLLVLGIAVGGSIATRLRPAPMVRTMLATAIVQVLVATTALAAGWASPGRQGVFEVVMSSSLFGGLWLISAALFRNAAKERASA